MNKIVILLLAVSFSLSLSAQKSKYEKAMESAVMQLDTTESAETIKAIANKFERIGNAEKDQWLPFYYQSLCNMRLAVKEMIGGNLPGTVPYVDKAQEVLNKAKELKENDSEITTLQGWIYMGKIWENPMANGAQYGPMSGIELQKAIELNPENPRPYALSAQNLLYTPEFYGGGAKVAIPLFEKADEKFNTFEAESVLHPTWGKGMNDYFLTEIRKTDEKK